MGQIPSSAQDQLLNNILHSNLRVQKHNVKFRYSDV